MKRLTVNIKNNETGETENFETNGMLGAFINKELGGDNSDTSQFILGNLTEKELIKLLAGCMNMVYHVAKDPKNAESFISISHQVAKEGFKQMMNNSHPYREGY